MKITSRTIVPGHDPDRVVETMLYRMDELAAFMPNVAYVETRRSDEREDGTVDVYRYWMGTTKSVHKLLRPFVTKNSLWWDDFALWTPAERFCTWRSESRHKRFTKCYGKTLFEPSGDGGTAVIIDGHLDVDGENIPGVPNFVGRRIAPRIERLVVGMMEPNFEATSKAIAALLDKTDAGAGEPA